MLAGGLLVIALTVSDYGVSWDEPVQQTYGELVRQYFLSGGHDDLCSHYSNLHLYGPAFELACAVISAPWPRFVHEIRHTLTAITALLTVPALVRLGRHLGSPWLGILGGLALILMPSFYGHAFVNSKDIPFACMYAWSMVLLLECFSDCSVNLRPILLAGVAVGLMLALRPGGLVLACLVTAMLFCWAATIRAKVASPWRRQFCQGMFLVFCIAWVVMVVPWPFAHGNVLLRPIAAVATSLRFPWRFPMLFEGQVVVSDHLPRRYLIEYLVITTPPAVVAFALTGLIVGLREQWRNPRTMRSFALFLLQAWFLMPVVLFLVSPPNVYDGVRHFLFLLPAMAMWYAIGMAWAVTMLARWGPRALALGFAVVVTFLPLPSLQRLHPYQMSYFNCFVGGVAGASGRYETDYWLLSYREAIEWVNQQARQHPDRIFTVMVSGQAKTIEDYAAKNVRVLDNDAWDNIKVFDRLPPGVDFGLLSIHRHSYLHFRLSPIVHAVTREGAIFTVIRARDDGTAP